MKAKYLSTLLFGALLVSSAGTFTSCNDDDNNNWQVQVDKLANLPTTETMKQAIEEARTSLQAKIDGLKGDLEVLSQAEKIKILEDKLADYNDLEERIKKFENIDYSKYIKSEDIAYFIGNTVLNSDVERYLQRKDEKYTSAVVNYVQTVLAIQTVSKTDFGTLETTWNNFINNVSEGVTLKSIADRLAELELYMDVIADQLEDGKDYSEVLTKIKQNKQDLSELAIPDAGDFLDVINIKFKKQDEAFQKIQNDLMDLGVLKNMIKSISFVSGDGTNEVNFSALKARVLGGNDKNSWIPLQSISTTRKLKFRVSPASAAESMTEYYTVELYSQKEETSGNEQPVKMVDINSLGSGLVEVDIDIDPNAQLNNYEVCLHATPKVGVTDMNKDIKSDNFTVNTGSLYLHNIISVASDITAKLDVVDEEFTPVDFNESDIKLLVSESESSSDTKQKTLSELGLSKDMLNIEYSFEDANEIFSIKEGVLAVKEGKALTAANAGQKITVKSIISFKNAVENQASYENTGLETYIYWTANIYCGEFTTAYSATVDARLYTKDTTLASKIFENLNVEGWSNLKYNHGMAPVRFLTGNVGVFVQRGTTTVPNDGIIKGEITTTNGFNKVNITAKVTITN